MKITILGFSGAGKSTLAAALGRRYGLPVLHLDRVHFAPGWAERTQPAQQADVAAFLDANSETGWVIDGNYTNLCYDRRLAESDAPVSEIAAGVGILDANYFIKLFKKAYGQTPLAWRKDHRL